MSTKDRDEKRYRANVTAPYISFDAVPAGGFMDDCLQLELACRYVFPTNDGVASEYEIVAHLRCSLPVAIRLRECLDRMLAAKQVDESPTVSHFTLN